MHMQSIAHQFRSRLLVICGALALSLSLLLMQATVLSNTVSAAGFNCNDQDALCDDGCTTVGQCVGGYKCTVKRQQLVKPPPDTPRTIRVLRADSSQPCSAGKGQAVLGGIEIPVGVWIHTPIGLQTSESIGIVGFASVLLRIFTIICGLWFMFNVIFAGFLFISSSTDTATFGKVKDSLYFSLIGLFLLAIAYMVAGVIGTIFFGDAGFILNPTLTQAGTAVTP